MHLNPTNLTPLSFQFYLVSLNMPQSVMDASIFYVILNSVAYSS